ncbi:glycoside hydrolase family 26 protein [Streptomyces sp. NBC_00344]|uniref:glycoside hydrolase family 26 protein n=1 Tax=Streptomyces sp. NBC_00344 TaxID=2975720 RepID=UPI002E20FACE
MTTGRPGPPWRPRAWPALIALAALLIGIGVWIARTDGTGARSGLPGNAASGERPHGPCAPTAALVPPCGAWWGAYVPYAKDGSLTRPVHAFEKRIGRRLDLLYTYHDMSRGRLDGQLLTPQEQELGRDRLLMLAWESTVWREPHHAHYTEDQLGWRNIADGTYDEDIIDPGAERIKAYGKRVFFSFDQEADARISEGAGTPAQYVAAYRHIHDRFERLGVDNVVWVWTVSGYLGQGNDAVIKSLYPGDGYVDWIGMDQYNYYLCHRTTDWNGFAQSQRPAYDWLRSHVSGEKPVMMAEFATAPDPGDPARQRDWYTGIPSALRSMPGAKALVQWDRAVPGKDCDLTVDSGPGLDGYRQAGRDSYFAQPVPGR